jgi:23S rRNA (pseudouridine1915-N3)-methyltransferase
MGVYLLIFRDETGESMKLQFLAIGKAHEPYVKSGVDDFTRRTGNYYPAVWQVMPPPKNAGVLGEPELKKKEAEMILASLGKDDYLVALDERGKQLSSAQLAVFIQARANESARQLVFLIGGAYGLHETVLKRANYTWSLSQLTFPHQLVRLILAEQVYRACTIQRNEKYHHQ